MADSRKTKAELLAEVRKLRARLAQLEPDPASTNAVAATSINPDEHFRTVADYTYDLESWISPDGQLLWVNPAVERLTGYSVAECLSMPEFPLPLVHQDDRPRVARVLQGAVGGSSGNDIPFRLQCKGGDVRWVAVSWQPIYSRDDHCLGHRSSIRDISDRKQAEDALQAQRALLDSIIAHIPCGVYWKDHEGRYQGCNAAFARAAGVPRPDDIVGRDDYELAWDREQAEWFRNCDERVFATGAALLNIEEAERQADGHVAQLLTSKVPLHDADGQVCGVLGIDTDISELKFAEAELRQARDELEVRVHERTAALAAANEQLRSSQERYRLVAELTSDFAYAFRAEPGGCFHTEWVTDAFARITGHLPGKLEPVSALEQIVHPDDRSIVQRRAQVLLAGKPLTTEFRIVTQDGHVRWLCDHARPIWDERARCVVRILGAAQDVTDRKQAEEESRQHQAALVHMARLSMLGELTAQLAHEINQPLCIIVGNAQTARRLLAAKTPDFVELEATLDDIATHGNRAADIIRRLRDFLRMQQPKPVVLNVQRVIEDVAALAEADARQHDARIQFDIAPHLPAVRGDAIQIQQVILNLVHNGLEAMVEMPAGTRALTVRARLDYASRVVVCVSDRGPGVPVDQEDRIFEPFFTTKPTGLGMGLVISRSIAEAYDGSLWMTRDREHGTTFHLALPGYDSGGEG